TSFRQVSLMYAKLAADRGVMLTLGAQVSGVRTMPSTHVLQTSKGDIETRFLINCGGLHSDRIARLSGVDPKVRIVPFRGEYFELTPEKRYLVKHLIYP